MVEEYIFCVCVCVCGVAVKWITYTSPQILGNRSYFAYRSRNRSNQDTLISDKRTKKESEMRELHHRIEGIDLIIEIVLYHHHNNNHPLILLLCAVALRSKVIMALHLFLSFITLKCVQLSFIKVR